MTRIPPDDVLERLYKLRTRESDQLKTVLELYDIEIHQKMSMPNYLRLKTISNFDCEISTPDMKKSRQEQW